MRPDPGGARKAGPAWGWSLTGLACTSVPSSSCFHGGTCVDGVNSFSCQCRPGYTGAHCQHEADPCLSRPCLHGGVCTAAHPGFRCTCPEGFTGAQCQVGVVIGGPGEAFGGSGTLGKPGCGFWEVVAETLRASPADTGGLVQPRALSERGSLCPDRDLLLLPLPSGVERPHL